MRYCDFEKAEFPDAEFELVRGRLFFHKDGKPPAHTNDGEFVDRGKLNGPDTILPPSDADE
jgi:hypothetical protein